MAETVKDFEALVKSSNATIKTADNELRYLRDQKRVYSAGKLTIAQEKSLTQINQRINELEDAKTEAKKDLDLANRLLPNLKTVENIDKQLEREYASYDRAARTGGRPNRSRINQLLQQREGLARVLMGYTPEAPKAPTSLGQTEGLDTKVEKSKTSLLADETAAKETAAETATPKPGKTPTKGTATGATTGDFEETAAGVTTPGAGAGAKTGGKTLKELLSATEFWYDLPDYIFNLDPKLGELLVKAAEEKWDNDKFLAQAKLTPWWQKNAAPIRQRIISKAKYDELRAAGEDVVNTEYALDTATIRRSVQARARQMGAGIDPNALEQIVSKIYSGFLENDELAIDAFIAPYIGKVSSIVGTGTGTKVEGFTGQALQNYQTLQAIAKANGLSLRDILPGISATTTGGDLETAVLRKLATGELDINRLAQDARLIAAAGQPKYVRDLLGQGYDLEQIYSPYKSVMASVLELNPDEIDLKELSGYGVFSDKGDTNIYDFKRALRKDGRWQYTEQARSEVSDSVLGVLRDFGFQG